MKRTRACALVRDDNRNKARVAIERYRLFAHKGTNSLRSAPTTLLNVKNFRELDTFCLLIFVAPCERRREILQGALAL